MLIGNNGEGLFNEFNCFQFTPKIKLDIRFVDNFLCLEENTILTENLKILIILLRGWFMSTEDSVSTSVFIPETDMFLQKACGPNMMEFSKKEKY